MIVINNTIMVDLTNDIIIKIGACALDFSFAAIPGECSHFLRSESVHLNGESADVRRY